MFFFFFDPKTWPKTAPPPVTPETLEALGVALHGPRFQAGLAADLASASGRAVTQSQVSAWLAGRRPIPGWLPGPAFEAAVRGAAALDARRVRAVDMAEEILLTHEGATGLHDPAAAAALAALRAPALALPAE